MNTPALYSPEEFVDDFEDLGLDRRIKAAKDRVNNGEEGATALVVLPSNLAEAFKPGGMTTFITAVTEKAKAFESDISTPVGQRQLKSFCHAIARTKTYADDAGKKFVADLKTKCKVVDGERKRMCDALDTLKAEVRKPLTEWEQIDEKRKAAHEAALAEAMAFGEQRRAGANSTQLSTMLDGVGFYKERNWEEFADRAKKVVGNVEHYLKEALATAVKAEAESEELARFRKEAAERAQKERDERIAAEAAGKAQRAAEERAAHEAAEIRRKAENERLEAQKKQEAAEKARVLAEGRIMQAEAQAKKEAEQAERNRIALIEQEKRHVEQQKEAKIAADKRAKDAVAKAELDKKEAAKKAVEAERQRAESERKRLADIEAKRAANLAHREAVKADAIDCLVIESLLNIEQATAVFDAINEGRITSVSISY